MAWLSCSAVHLLLTGSGCGLFSVHIYELAFNCFAAGRQKWQSLAREVKGYRQGVSRNVCPAGGLRHSLMLVPPLL